MQLFCQIVVAVLLVVNVFTMTYSDFQLASKGDATAGMIRFGATLIVSGAAALVLYGAGAFSEILR